MKNPYDVLGVPINATITDIKAAFRRLAKETNPDVNDGNEQMTVQFQDVVEAYAILSDPAKKSQWDAFNQEGASQKQATDSDSSYYSSVRAAAADIEGYIHALYEEIKPYKEAAKKSISVGMLWLVGGLVVTFGSYMYAVNSGGGTYVITWGAILFGGIKAIRSFSQYAKINKAVAQAETEMWKAFN